MKTFDDYALDILNVLKFNPQLTDDEKLLCVSLRLEQMYKALAEKEAAERIIVSDHTYTLPPELQVAKPYAN